MSIPADRVVVLVQEVATAAALQRHIHPAGAHMAAVMDMVVRHPIWVDYPHHQQVYSIQHQVSSL